jgi:hypothetical protein
LKGDLLVELMNGPLELLLVEFFNIELDLKVLVFLRQALNTIF